MEQTEFAKEFFNGEKLPVQRIGQGIHNGVFYYGTLNAYGNQAVITSDKKLYAITEDGDSIREEFGLNYRYGMEESLIWHVWTNESALRYLNNGYVPKDIKTLFNDIKAINEEFVDHVDLRIHAVVACDIIADYLNCLFESRGITHIWALKGSGKTKQSRIYRGLSFNVMWSSKVSVAALYKSVESNCGRVIIDNFDNIRSEELRAAYSQLLQTGWESDGIKHHCEPKTDRVVAFRTYCPYLINNIVGLDDTTADRTLKFNMLKTVSLKGKRQPNFRKQRWGELREQLRFWALDNWKKVEKTRDVVDSTIDLNNREKDIGLAVLTIAQMVGKDVFDAVFSYIKEKAAEEKVKDLSEDWEYVLFKEIKKRVENMPEKQGWIELADIGLTITPLLYPDIDRVIGKNEYEKPNSEYQKVERKIKRWIPKHLRKIPLFKKKRLVKGKTQIYFIEESVDRYRKVKEIDKEDIDESGGSNHV